MQAVELDSSAPQPSFSAVWTASWLGLGGRWCASRTLLPTLLALAAVASWGQVAHAQSYLEKLESLVEQFKQPTSEPKENAIPSSPAGSVEELPAPKESQPPSNAIPAKPLESISGGASILEPPSISAPPPLTSVPRNQIPGATSPAAATPSVSSPAETAGRLYLGLEAEELQSGGLGVRVSHITNRSPAWKAGFEVHDRIVAINGNGITTLDDMVEQLSPLKPGDSARFLVTREGRSIELVVVFMDADLAQRIAGGTSSAASLSGKAWLGVEAADLSTEFRNQFGISAFRGAAVTNVASGSPASLATIQAGDCIVEAGGKPIQGVRDLQVWLAGAEAGDTVQLMVYRGGFSRKLAVTLTNASVATRDKRLPTDRINNTRGTIAMRPAPPAPSAEAAPASPIDSREEVALQLTPEEPSAASPETVRRIADLEDEVRSLRDELQQAREKLRSTQSKLNQIVNGLKIEE
ncbi:PDZ domain-containing protein [Aureliella helgolandensis]|nr:PDZ domain-containing protein [Aureliella helgolandensis]